MMEEASSVGGSRRQSATTSDDHSEEVGQPGPAGFGLDSGKAIGPSGPVACSHAERLIRDYRN